MVQLVNVKARTRIQIRLVTAPELLTANISWSLPLKTWSFGKGDDGHTWSGQADCEIDVASQKKETAETRREQIVDYMGKIWGNLGFGQRHLNVVFPTHALSQPYFALTCYCLRYGT